ncbi:hypothetical protein SNEBB_002142 [Seison nebaliae]|nr:hypothetical protein SNEBB_002142 [Seison nebaliae]
MENDMEKQKAKEMEKSVRRDIHLHRFRSCRIYSPLIAICIPIFLLAVIYTALDILNRANKKDVALALFAQLTAALAGIVLLLLGLFFLAIILEYDSTYRKLLNEKIRLEIERLEEQQTKKQPTVLEFIVNAKRLLEEEQQQQQQQQKLEEEGAKEKLEKEEEKIKEKEEEIIDDSSNENNDEKLMRRTEEIQYQKFDNLQKIPEEDEEEKKILDG